MSRNASQDPVTSLFLRACRRQNRDRPPVWIMRQAGRYLPEYQELRRRHTFVEMCTSPELAVEISLQPLRRFEFDAAIVFYDILFLPEAMGAPLRFDDRGPAFLHPIRERSHVEALHPPDLEARDPKRGIGVVLDSLKALRSEVSPALAVLGFAGAPFTLATYLVEGEFRGGERIRRLAVEDPHLLHDLLARLTDATCDYLSLQIDAGADAVQLFDTWAGILSLEAYNEFALPYQKRIFARVAECRAPGILYVNGGPHLLTSMAQSGATALSVDWREPLASVRERVGSGLALQGNLDPATLFAPAAVIRRKTRELLQSMAPDAGHVLNLGHGIHRDTPIEAVEVFVEEAKAFSVPP